MHCCDTRRAEVVFHPTNLFHLTALWRRKTNKKKVLLSTSCISARTTNHSGPWSAFKQLQGEHELKMNAENASWPTLYERQAFTFFPEVGAAWWHFCSVDVIKWPIFKSAFLIFLKKYIQGMLKSLWTSTFKLCAEGFITKNFIFSKAHTSWVISVAFFSDEWWPSFNAALKVSLARGKSTSLISHGLH